MKEVTYARSHHLGRAVWRGSSVSEASAILMTCADWHESEGSLTLRLAAPSPTSIWEGGDGQKKMDWWTDFHPSSITSQLFVGLRREKGSLGAVSTVQALMQVPGSKSTAASTSPIAKVSGRGSSSWTGFTPVARGICAGPNRSWFCLNNLEEYPLAT